MLSTIRSTYTYNRGTTKRETGVFICQPNFVCNWIRILLRFETLIANISILRGSKSQNPKTSDKQCFVNDLVQISSTYYSYIYAKQSFLRITTLNRQI